MSAEESPVEVVTHIDPRQGRDARCNIVGVCSFELDFAAGEDANELVFSFTRGLMPGELSQVATGQWKLPDTIFLEFMEDGIVEAIAIIPQDTHAKVLALYLDPDDRVSSIKVDDIEKQAGKLDSRHVIFMECLFKVAHLEPLETSYSMITPKE